MATEYARIWLLNNIVYLDLDISHHQARRSKGKKPNGLSGRDLHEYNESFKAFDSVPKLKDGYV
jgi:hypothetical protein